MATLPVRIDVHSLLPIFERARQALAEARTLDEVKHIRDQAQAIQAYLHQQRAGLEMQNNAADVKLRAERRLGEMLAATPKHEGGRPAANYTHDGLGSPQTLKDLGIDDHQSHRWQQVAKLPEADFERLIAERKAEQAELTSAYILQAARALFRDGIVTPPLPVGVFDVIYADPPWQYDNQIESWGPTSLHYPTMPLHEIKAMALENKVPSAEHATLFLWSTNPFLEDALEVVQEWGFEYKTNIVWVKRHLTRPGSGFYVRGRHELLFICTKGNHVPDQRGKEPIGSVLEADVEEHSQKPEAVYQIIESLYPNAKRLELFARRERPGWTPWALGAASWTT